MKRLQNDMTVSVILLLAFAAITPSLAFSGFQSVIRTTSSSSSSLSSRGTPSWEEPLHKDQHELNRRSVLSVLSTFSIANAALPAAAEDKEKVVVFGGSGWVGAHVSQVLADKGYAVVSISRSSAVAQAARAKSILGSDAAPSIGYVQLDALQASADDLASAIRGATAVVSCVGIAPGSPAQKDGNGLSNARIAMAARQAGGVRKFVYIGVASAVANGPAKFLIGDYFQGKAQAESAVAREFGERSGQDTSYLLVKPAIVAGATPGEIRPPGPPGVKPLDVGVLANVVVAGVVGGYKGVIDGNDAIVAAAS